MSLLARIPLSAVELVSDFLPHDGGHFPAPLESRQEGQAGLRRSLAQEGRAPAGGGLGAPSRRIFSPLSQW